VSPQELKWIEKSLLAREKVFSKGQKENTDCYRLFNGQGEGIPGLVIEQYGTVLIFQWHEGKCQLRSDAIKTLEQWYSDKIRNPFGGE
jgi:23S rRNA G2069 N7-methylase RlmK/C1962 C5-methylase RlmI